MLIVSAYVSPHVGGVELVVDQQARTLAALGYLVTVVASGAGGGDAGERRDGYEVVRVPAWNGLEARFDVPIPIWSPRALWRLACLVGRADVVHVHDVYHPASCVAALAAWWRGRPLFVTQHVATVAHDRRSVALAQRAYYSSAARLVWRRAATIEVYNAIVHDFLVDHGVERERLRLTYNGVDTSEFCPGDPATTPATRARYGIATDRPVVLFAGRLVPKKGVQQLLRATSPRYQIVVAGPGNVPDDVPDGVLVLGPVSRSELLALYRASDIFAYPASGEMLTLAMQEAMSCGLPVVTTDEQDYGRYDLDPAGVALVPPDARSLRAAFLEIIDDDDRRAYMQRYSRSLAEERFDWDNNAAGLVAQYEAADGPVRARARP